MTIYYLDNKYLIMNIFVTTPPLLCKHYCYLILTLQVTYFLLFRLADSPCAADTREEKEERMWWRGWSEEVEKKRRERAGREGAVNAVWEEEKNIFFYILDNFHQIIV